MVVVGRAHVARVDVSLHVYIISTSLILLCIVLWLQHPIAPSSDSLSRRRLTRRAATDISESRNTIPRHGLDSREDILQMVRPIARVAHRQLTSLFPISRLNSKLEANGHPPMRSLVQDLSDGVRLIQLMVR